MLVALWLLAWGQVTVANLLSGVVVAGALLAAFPPGPRRHAAVRLDLGGAARLGVHVVTQLVVSNVVMAAQIVRRRSQAQPGILAHPLQRPSDEVITLMTTIISLSPGTMTVDVARDSTIVYVHFFDLRDIDAARGLLARLERLVAGAIPADVSTADPSESETP
jgi:multicomponent Na+:H+ antiporter subunit E